MVNKLFLSAKEYMKDGKWKNAIENFESIFNKKNTSYQPEMYTLYAKSLKKINKVNQSKEILTNGLNHFQKNEELLIELLDITESSYEWKNSEKILSSLIKINPENEDYYFRLGRVYSYLNKPKEAEKTYKKGLIYKHKISFDELIQKIQLGFTVNPNKVKTQYSFIHGKNNLGVFTHHFDNQKFFTKISLYNSDSKREEIFYKNIRAEFPILNDITPDYIDSQIIDDVMYLTVEMIDNDTPVKKKHTDKIIAAASNISKIRYADVINKYPNPKYSFEFVSRPIPIFRLFTQIHKKDINQKLFSSFHYLLKQKEHPEIAINTLDKLESLIMENKLYLYMDPRKHYSLLQGDFIISNMKIKNESPIIFDWALFNVGPHFMDIANYLSSMFIPYSKVKKLYLFHDERGNKMSLIEKIFFLYALIVLYTVQPSVRTIDIRLSEFILPAMDDLEKLVSKFKKEEFVHLLDSLLIKKDELKNMEQEINNLKNKNLLLTNKYNNILNSKSWKLTAYLRNIKDKIKNKGNKT